MAVRVLICDDDKGVADEWRNSIQEILNGDQGYELLDPPTREVLGGEIQELLARQDAVRNEDKARKREEGLFDQSNVLIIDYDLLHIDHRQGRHTGEQIARLARSFATTGIIIVLNQHHEVQFDLSLKGNLRDSHADMNIHDDVIATRGLWLRDSGEEEEFNPWYWPLLSDAAQAFERRVESLLKLGTLDAPILPHFGFRKEDADALSDSAFSFVGPSADDADQLLALTFREFISDNSNAVERRDGEKLVEGHDDSCARVIASRLSKWLERAVLAPQDVLVDVPHLIERMPFLLGEDVGNLEVWNSAVHEVPKSMLGRIPQDAWFKETDWLSKPALWWNRIEADEKLTQERLDFDYSAVPPFVFREDASNFGLLDESTPFRADFQNQYDRRYVKKFGQVIYAPRRRFSI